MKNTVICDLQKFIWFLGKTTQGSIHDLFLVEVEFDIRQKWFDGLRLLVDLGYLGIDKYYEIKDLYIGIKKKRTKKGEPPSKLSFEDKQYNKALNQVRIIVEHAIGGIKRYDILTNKYRNKIFNFDDLVMEVSAGLWNLELSVKKS